ncbi:hypothetical protein V5P93_003651 [Actinokineospora auranticolor]|uniref:hypothetical protein n=1 Tax=Actinokineospora auranticolor TaxID=155976 RepID=UPI0011B06592|nr:hypothetical protein [Actinokineospora auranticolor]
MDGLDEESGTGRTGIAHLLPARPRDGLRIIVSSRPHRPRPEAISRDLTHPLCDPRVVRELTRSPDAAQRESEVADVINGHADLRAWAEDWRSRDWPEDTPEYLLGRYFALLESLGDVDGVLHHATSTARHDRMYELTGSDTAALAEVATAQRILLEQPDPSVETLFSLAVHRLDLAGRSADVPPGLVAVWARLGYAARARGPATGLSDPRARITALAAALRHTAADADAQRLRADAEAAVPDIADPRARMHAECELGRALAARGDFDGAEEVAAALHPDRRTDVLVEVIRAAWARGDRDRARAASTAVTQPKRHHRRAARPRPGRWSAPRRSCWASR